MAFKIIVALCVLVAVAAAIPAAGGPGPWGPWGPPGAPAGGANPWLPPWLAAAPWMPQWAPCATLGSTCADCNTKQVCTKFGGMLKACTDPTTPYCNAGSCSATPTAECAPVSETTAV